MLPIDSALPEIVRLVGTHPNVIVEAPPGAGKTTRIAPALCELGGYVGRIVLVQPRRIAARAAASRIADEMGVSVGDRVGYHVRFDCQTSRATQLVAMTPGILLRQLQSDATLSDTSVVILDEFHERSLEYDLLLGMLRRVQQEIRPELKLVVMSATLNTQSIWEYLEQPPVVRVPGQLYPVSVRYSRMGSRGKLTDQVAEKIVEAASEEVGDMLVFLPGVGEIEQVARLIESQATREKWIVFKLYGDLPPREQDRVLQPTEERKIILSTNIAETSLTIDGVRIVIDSGWARVGRVDPGLGLNMLVLEPISKASAAQRCGRAGRTAPGVCYRLWDEATHRGRAEHLEPEILRVDLAAAILQLICWGESQPNRFPWITAPRPSAEELAWQLLKRLDAVTEGRPTELGRQLLQIPVQPRLARLIFEGWGLGIGKEAALTAALLSERDVFDRRGGGTPRGIPTRSTKNHHCDVTERVLALQRHLQGGSSGSWVIRPGAAKQLTRVAEQLYQSACQAFGRAEGEECLTDQLPMALLAAFPDRLARRRSLNDARGIMVGGRGVKLDQDSGVREAELFLCIDVDAGAGEATVRQASGIDASWLPRKHLRHSDDRFLHPTQGTVVTRRRLLWMDLVIEETPIATPLDEETAELLVSAAIAQWHKVLPTNDKALTSWISRVRWLAEMLPEAGLPSYTAEGLADSLRQWCVGLRGLDELKQLPWQQLLESLLDSQQRALVQKQAPENFRLPSGRVVTLQYELGKPPILAARIQEFFGLRETPRVASGRVPLLLHLLAPNMRCQQITDDLASFWKNTYAVVRKELRARYPKHDWPENP